MEIRFYFISVGKLILSLLVDIVGVLTYLAPGQGEFLDLILAFISKAIVNSMYLRNSHSNWVLLEEILPFTDVIPSATIIWFMKHLGSKKEAFNEFMEKRSL